MELKLGMFIIDHCRTNLIDFGERRMIRIFFYYTNTKNNSDTLWSTESNYYKCAIV